MGRWQCEALTEGGLRRALSQLPPPPRFARSPSPFRGGFR